VPIDGARFAAVHGAHALVVFTDVGATAIVLTNRRRNAFGLTTKRFSPIVQLSLVAVREEAKMAGPQGPLCHWLMARATPPVLGGRLRLDLSRFDCAPAAGAG
jgi:hypothetical protein